MVAVNGLDASGIVGPKKAKAGQNGEGQIAPPASNQERTGQMAQSNYESACVGRGMAIAAGIVAREFGQDTIAEEILNAAGYQDADTMRRDGCSEYDIEACRRVLNHMKARA